MDGLISIGSRPRGRVAGEQFPGGAAASAARSQGGGRGNDGLFRLSGAGFGVLVIAVPRDGKTAPLRILAPGCKAIDEPIGVDEKAVVMEREFDLEPLSAKDAASFTGRVLRPDGQPASKAIVRICDWDVTPADGQGQFQFARVTSGTFVVRRGGSGGELQEEMTFVAGQELKEDLALKAVTTVGIRWALQTQEGSRELTGDGIHTGKAYFSVDHSRFLLSRGAQTRDYYGSDFMLMSDWKGVRKFLSKEQVAALEASNQFTVAAYVLTWAIQLGYLAWLGLRWRAQKRDAARSLRNPR